jgi:hypothetical protein
MIGLSEMIWLFYMLTGLCVGWLRGAFNGVLVGIVSSLGGCVVGFVAGLFATQVPRDVKVTTARLSRKNKVLGALFGILGYLVWLALSLAFWWVCASFMLR